MTTVLTIDEIKNLVDIPTLLTDIEAGFVHYSAGQVNVPPVGFLHFADPPGDVHIKYGYRSGDDYYVMKVASAFYNNPALNLPTGDGLFLVFNSKTGKTEYILLDQGWLTDIRTAAAGAIAAKHLANPKVEAIGIVGNGIQARMQLELLCGVVESPQCYIWGRNASKTTLMINELRQSPLIREWGIELSAVSDLSFLVNQSRLIVTTTSARSPLIQSCQVQKGTHITAMGADDHGKQELSGDVLAKADIVVADSISQCIDHGECGEAIKNGSIEPSSILELGNIIQNSAIGRSHPDQITVADLTGVAIQDIQIAKMISQAHSNKPAS